MDPMCSWCFAFAEPLRQLQTQTNLSIEWIMGGLAPDNDEPMSEEMKATIAGYWQKISALTGVQFNHDFWSNNIPRRSSYPACRAVIAAEKMMPGSSQQMAGSIQQAYFEQAQSPSDTEVLISCAEKIGLNAERFGHELHGEAVEMILQQHLNLVQQWGIQGFPALLLTQHRKAAPLTLGYCSTAELTAHYQDALRLFQ